MHASISVRDNIYAPNLKDIDMRSKVDIESAVVGLFEPDSIDENAVQFFITDKSEKKSWVEIRAGSSGDAAYLAILFSQQETVPKRTDSNYEEIPVNYAQKLEALEMKIEDSMGNERLPPSVHILVAEICTEIDHSNAEEGNIDKPMLKQICGAAFACIDWNPDQSMRYLCVEEIAIDESKIEEKGLLLRRFLLSFSAIALKTSCGGLLIASSASRFFNSTMVELNNRENTSED